MDSVYLDNNAIASKFRDKDVILFGAGGFGDFFWIHFYGILNVKFYVDNGTVAGQTLHHTPILHFNELSAARNSEPIIITSPAYTEEISYQLFEAGYRRGEDYFIWRNKRFDWPYDENITAFVEHNKKVWGDTRITETNNKILIPFLEFHQIEQIVWSYFANYLAKKYDARIVCFVPFGTRGMFASLQEVYESYNVCEYVFQAVTPAQEIKCDELTDEIYSRIKTRQDLRHIEVYGEDFGKEICETYLRFDPHLDTKDAGLKRYLRGMIARIVWWHDFFEREHNVKALLWGDDVYWGGITRKFALKKGVPAYTAVHCAWKWEFGKSYNFKYYKKWFDSLSSEEKTFGITWAKKHLQNRLQGSTEDMPFCYATGFHEKTSQRLLKESSRIKVLICPHYFCDEPYPCGWQIFDDPYEWLLYLGNLSNKKTYDWYLKMHPLAGLKDKKMIHDFLNNYPNIELLPENASPQQLKEEGLDFALTIHGSIAHEYPLLGIQVINAGNNPHIAFGFSYTPHTVEEYENIMMNLEEHKKKVDLDEVYQFYCIHMLYYEHKEILVCEQFLNNFRKYATAYEMFHRDWCQNNEGIMEFTKIYKDFLDQWSPKRHEALKKTVVQFFDCMDQYKEGMFMKRKDVQSIGGQ